MLKVALRNLIDAFRPAHAEEEGQDTFEYLLVTGVVVVAIVGAVSFGPALVATVEGLVTTAITGLF